MRGRSNSSRPILTPGPGNYNLRSEKSMEVPSYRFGKEIRDRSISKEAIQRPGPGLYSANTSFINKSTPKFSFGKELRADRGRPLTPGPGQYQAKTYLGKEGPKITMSSRPQTGNPNRVPGPGQYNYSMISKPNTPSFRIGSAKREAFIISDKSPGPAQYSPQNDVISNRPKSPNWKLGTSSRDWSGNNMNPGPGNYNITKGLGEGPKYSMTGKNFYNGPKLEAPGPGQYNETKTHLAKNPAWKIGTSSRDEYIRKTIKENYPGPGNYSSNSKSEGNPSFRFGTQKRDWNLKSETPGPGQYHIPCSMVDVPAYQRNSSSFQERWKFI